MPKITGLRASAQSYSDAYLRAYPANKDASQSRASSITMVSPTTANPRLSVETDRRHLLFPSEAASQASSLYDGDQTPRAHSPEPDQKRRGTVATSGPYRGFASEAEYLQAFHEWAESKKLVDPGSNQFQFYGTKTSDEVLAQPRVELGLSRKWREHKAKREARRASAI